MSLLVFLEHHGNELQKGSLGVLAKAAALGGEDVAGVVLGSGIRALAESAGKFGAAKVYVADDSQLEAPLPQPRVDVLARLVGETSAISGSPPPTGVASNEPARKSASRGVPFQPTSA